MGKRARGRGVANAALRAARAAARERDGEASAIAQRVYGTAVDLQREERLPIPVPIAAPLYTAAELAAVSLCEFHGIERTEANVKDISTYFVVVFREASEVVTPEWLETWRARVRAAENEGS